MRNHSAKEFFYDTSFKDYKLVNTELRKKILALCLFSLFFSIHLAIAYFLFDVKSFITLFNDELLLNGILWLKIFLCSFFIIFSFKISQFTAEAVSR